MVREKECCGLCRWHWKDESSGEWYCAKWGCEFENEYTPYDFDECEDFEERD